MSEIIGYGGGGKGGAEGGRTPKESPDSLHSISYAKLLDLVSEGEIEGLVNGMQSIYFDETPLQNSDGSFNFQDVKVDLRTGTQTQDYIAGFPAVENETTVNVEFKDDTPYSRSITNSDLTAVKVRLAINNLSFQDLTNGDLKGYRVAYVIELSTAGGSFVEVINTAFDGKTISRYERTHRIELPPSTSGWVIRVRRLTPNATASNIQDDTYVAAVTEVIDAKLRYPMSAIIGIQIDASQFSGIPTRGYHLRGKRIKVPDNYDPVARTYDGVWEGVFKVAYSNNPAWIFYDLVLNEVYGLGSRVKASQLDRYALYEIARYCDVMVSDGKGGMEPRFACNVYLQARADAYRVLQDFASVFRGMAFWGAGQITTTADMPTDPVYTYTAANVIDGAFASVGNPIKSRYSVALVSWNDPSDFYRNKVEAVQDEVAIRRYGLQQVELTAFGCTSQAQAQRVGLWATTSSRLETGTISFQVGMDGQVCLPGQVIRVADPVRMGRRNAGRIRSATSNSIIVDKIEVVNVGDPLTVILPNAIAETRTVLSVSGETVTVSEEWSEIPSSESVWSIDNVDLVAPTYKVLSVTEKTDLVFEVTAAMHEPGKYAFIDNGTRIDSRPITVVPPTVQAAPPSVTITGYDVENQGIVSSTMLISWEAAPSAIAYLPEWKKDDGNWVPLPRTGQLSAEVSNIYNGGYLARVRAVNPLEVQSLPTYSVETELNGKTTPPPSVTFLNTSPIIFGINVSWGFPVSGATDVQRTEIWYGETSILADATKLGDFAYPQSTHQILGLAAGQSFFFWARLVDRSGNIGPFYPTGAGVVGTASADATEILDYLAGQITDTQLSDELLAQIGGEDILLDLDGVRDYLASTQIQALVAADKGILATSERSAAALLLEQTVRADETGALAESVETALAASESGVAIAETALQASSDTNGQLAAMYTIKTQVTSGGRTYIAGIGVGVDNSSGVTESQVLVTADRFAIINDANGVVTVPFAVTGGQTFINNAVIGNASIGSAKLADWLVSDTLGPGGIPVLRLNFRTGEIQLNAPISGGGRLSLTNEVIQVFDASNVLRVKMGRLS